MKGECSKNGSQEISGERGELMFKKECILSPAVPNVNRNQIIKKKAPEERHVIVSNSHPGFNPDSELEVRDERRNCEKWITRNFRGAWRIDVQKGVRLGTSGAQCQ